MKYDNKKSRVKRIDWPRRKMAQFPGNQNCYCSLIVLILFSACLLDYVSQVSFASGVFEFELIDFKRLDIGGYQTFVAKPPSTLLLPTGSQQASPATPTTTNTTTTGNENCPTQKQQQQWPMRVVVCLKDPFGQLDGPCTYGNASITFGGLVGLAPQQESQIARTTSGGGGLLVQTVAATSQTPPRSAAKKLDESRATTTSSPTPDQQIPMEQRNNATNGGGSTNGVELQLANDQQGSLLTNVVRIQFTFRWPKSFLIILRVKQLGPDEAEREPSVAPSEPEPPAEQANQEWSPIKTERKLSSSVLSAKQSSSSIFIDRHLSGENEVLPNLGDNSSWTTRILRSFKSSLMFRYRVLCARNHFGDGCTTFCRPRDDQWGHYTCSPTGHKVCLDGWSGLECTKARCAPGCSPQHGFCERPDTCECLYGWMGPLCDQCRPDPQCKHGYCLAPWKCLCHEGWGGILCDQEVNYCATHDPCRNNGTCQNVAPGRYKCSCPDGFGGANCETNLSAGFANSLPARIGPSCLPSGCLNGGTCYEIDASGGPLAGANFHPTTPNHIPAIVGHSNQTTTMEQEQMVQVDINHSSSRTLIYKCECLPGWTGDYCQEQVTIASGPTLPLQTTHDLSPSSTTAFNQDSTNLPSNGTTSFLESEIMTEDSSVQLTTVSSTRNLHHLQHQSQLEMRHLVSGVVVASALGVFVAALMLAWCCLVAIEKNKFSFIQMNIVRHSHSDNLNDESPTPSDYSCIGVSSTLRRMQEKLRNSLRRSQHSSSSIKPETKLSIENVLRPPKLAPPSYEESSNIICAPTKFDYVSRTMTGSHYQKKHFLASREVPLDRVTLETSNDLSQINHVQVSVVVGALPDDVDKRETTTSSENMEKIEHEIQVEKGSLVKDKEVVVPLEAINAPLQLAGESPDSPPISTANLNCPRHGHLYRRQQQQQRQLISSAALASSHQAATTIEIEYKPPKTLEDTNVIDHFHEQSCQPYNRFWLN